MRGSHWPNHLALVAATAMATVAIYRQVIAREHDEAIVRSAPENGATMMRQMSGAWPAKPARRGRSHSQDGRTSCIAPISKSTKTAFSQQPPASYLTACWRSFPPSRHLCIELRTVCISRHDYREPAKSVAHDARRLVSPSSRTRSGACCRKGSVTLGWAFVIGLVMAVWSANAGMKAILDALNVVYEEDEKRSFIKLNLVSLSFTIAALAGILIMVSAVVAVPLLLQHLGLGERAELIISVGRWPMLGAPSAARAGDALSIRPQPCNPAMAVAECGRRAGRSVLARRFSPLVLVSCKF